MMISATRIFCLFRGHVPFEKKVRVPFLNKRYVSPVSGVAMLEYVMVIVIVIVALVAFSRYMQQAMQGQYKKAGETFAFGRQYTPPN